MSDVMMPPFEYNKECPLSERAQRWLENYVWYAKNRYLPNREIVDELSKYKPKKPVRLLRGISSKTIKTEPLKKLKSYSYEAKVAAAIAGLGEWYDPKEPYGKIEARFVNPDEIIVDFTYLPEQCKLDFPVDEVIVMSKDLRKKLRTKRI